MAKPSTDPDWDGERGGLPERPATGRIVFGPLDGAAATQAPLAWPSDTAGTAVPSTVTPPERAGLTAEQADKLADVLDELVQWLRRRG